MARVVLGDEIEAERRLSLWTEAMTTAPAGLESRHQHNSPSGSGVSS
jgi:hypothetical protein